MEPTPPWLTKTQFRPNEQSLQKKHLPSDEVGRTIEVKSGATKRPTSNLIKPPLPQVEGEKRVGQNVQPEGERFSHHPNTLQQDTAIADQPTEELQPLPRITKHLGENSSVQDINTQQLAAMAQAQAQLLPETTLTPSLYNPVYKRGLGIPGTLEPPHVSRLDEQPTHPLTALETGYHIQPKSGLTRKKALLLIILLGIILVQALQQGSQQIFGSQGWAYVLGEPGTQKINILSNISKEIHTATANKSKTKITITPQQYINAIIQSMTFDQKLGQMMLVQFVGSDYSLDLSTMISQYNVGSVLLLTGNHNIISKDQLTGLTQQMQHNSTLPMIISLDQEGGEVDRLVNLDGPRPSAAQIGATGDPAQAIAAGKQDAQDLSQYGINLQLAPIVDVGTPYSIEQEQGRTFGQDAATVTKMAGAYLQGLQQSGKVLGTLKHFPDLGSSTVDPHQGLPVLNDSLDKLNNVDWTPYKNLIEQGSVHAIMVTHEIVAAIDSTTPASLSSKIVTGVIRDQMGFQGVIMTDSLTMEGISAYYTTKQAAVLAVEAGSDIIMGADAPTTVATMIEGIKEAVNTGNISEQRIDQSVYRILMMKYQMGLLTIPKN
jgi:beta-N-acetylhexosaminidase